MDSLECCTWHECDLHWICACSLLQDMWNDFPQACHQRPMPSCQSCKMACVINTFAAHIALNIENGQKWASKTWEWDSPVQRENLPKHSLSCVCYHQCIVVPCMRLLCISINPLGVNLSHHPPVSRKAKRLHESCWQLPVQLKPRRNHIPAALVIAESLFRGRAMQIVVRMKTIQYRNALVTVFLAQM